MRVYLSGSMANRFAQEVQAERAEATEELAKINVKAVDPAAAEKELWGKHLKAKIQNNMRLKIIDAMVQKDLWLIRRSDLLLVLTGSTPSDGTWWEMCYARFSHIPVIMISSERCKKKNPLTGWSNIMVERGNVVPDLKSAVRLIKRKYLKEDAERKAYFNAAIKKRNFHKKEK